MQFTLSGLEDSMKDLLLSLVPHPTVERVLDLSVKFYFTDSFRERPTYLGTLVDYAAYLINGCGQPRIGIGSFDEPIRTPPEWWADVLHDVDEVSDQDADHIIQVARGVLNGEGLDLPKTEDVARHIFAKLVKSALDNGASVGEIQGITHKWAECLDCWAGEPTVQATDELSFVDVLTNR